jgi:uncharacterized ion transporter superfamily protein YfcC
MIKTRGDRGEKMGLDRIQSTILALIYILSIPTFFYGLIADEWSLAVVGGIFFAVGLILDIKFDNLLGKLKGERK